MKDKIEKLTTQEKWQIETALEEQIATLRNRYTEPTENGKYIHPADKYDTLLTKLQNAECVYIQNS